MIALTRIAGPDLVAIARQIRTRHGPGVEMRAARGAVQPPLDERLLAALTGPDDGVVVSGPAPAGGVPSTIVEPLAGTDLRVLRLGAVSLEALKAAGFTPHLA